MHDLARSLPRRNIVWVPLCRAHSLTRNGLQAKRPGPILESEPLNAESPEQTEPGSDEQTNAAETAALDVQPEQPASEESPARVWQPRSPRQHLMVGLGLTVLLGALYLPGLGSYGLYDPWETHYGEVARNMVENANYIDPFWGSPWDPSGVKKREREGFIANPL